MAHIATKVQHNNIQSVNIRCGTSSRTSQLTSLSSLGNTASVAVINYSQEQLGTMIDNIAGDYARMTWIDEANDCQPVFPKEDNYVSWDVGTD